jgi:hypothetical protein
VTGVGSALILAQQLPLKCHFPPALQMPHTTPHPTQQRVVHQLVKAGSAAQHLPNAAPTTSGADVQADGWTFLPQLHVPAPVQD